MPAETPVASETQTPAPAPSNNVTSFEDYLEQAISSGNLTFGGEPADDAPAPATPEAKKETPAAPEAPLFKVPEEVTKAIIDPEGAKTPAAPDPEAKEKELDELFKTKQGEAFSRLKSELKELRKVAAEKEAALHAQIEEAKKSTVPNAEVERLRREADEAKRINAEYEQELALVKVEATREYKETVQKRLNQINTTVRELADKYKVSEREVFAALQETDPTKQDTILGEIATAFHERDRLRLYSLIEQHAEVSKQDKFVRENAATALRLIEERRNQELTQAKQAQESEYSRALDTAWGDLQNNFTFLRPIEGQTEWNQTIDEMTKFARSLDVDALKPHERAHLVMQGVAMPVMARALQYYAAELSRERAEKAKTATIRPGAGGGSPAPAAPSSQIDSNVGFLDALEMKFSGV